MLIDRFERLGPLCPACRLRGAEEPLRIALVEIERAGDVEAGLLACDSCGTEYPVLDGVPVIVPDLSRYVQDNLFYLLIRGEFPAGVAGLIGDAAGPGTAYDLIRQHLSCYAWDHWADQDPAEAAADGSTDSPAENPGAPRPGAIVRAVAAGLDLLGPGLPDGPILDIGCGTGRSVVELAARTGREVLGIDLSVPLARFAQAAIVRRTVAYDRRRLGLSYERRRFDIGLDWPAGSAEIWQCDLLALPFRRASFALAAGFNVLDNLADPRAGLAAMESVLRPGGGAVLCTPFDWSANVTPQAAWLGGHSRGGAGPEPVLAELLAASGALHEIRTREIPWHVRLHDRSHVCYRSHLATARRLGAPEDTLPSRRAQA